MGREFTVEQRNVIKYAKEVSGVLLFGTVAAVVTIAARVFGEGKIEVANISVPLSVTREWVTSPVCDFRERRTVLHGQVCTATTQRALSKLTPVMVLGPRQLRYDSPLGSGRP